MYCMLELGQLEKMHEDFAARNTQVIASSVEGDEDAKKTQKDFPHLTILSDAKRGLSSAAEVIHERSAPDGGDTSAPTIIVIDKKGQVRWLYRPGEAISRVSPAELLHVLDEKVSGAR